MMKLWRKPKQMKSLYPLFLRPLLLSSLLFGVVIFPIFPVFAHDAEIISIIGRGDTRVTSRSDWHAATVRQQISAGAFVRTHDLSEVALLLQDQTQLRLNQDSMVQIKKVSSAGATTELELTRGRVWAQAKRKIFTQDPSLPPAVMVQTPNATAAIRGTEWELAVDERGAATLTVLSGVVDFYNQFGRVFVSPNEQAHVEPGKAPTKMLLTNAQERVQWVTAYRPQPRRWLQPVPAACEPAVRAIEKMDYRDAFALLDALRGTPEEAAATLLRADLDLALGRVATAIHSLEGLPKSPQAAALLARAYLIADRSDDAAHLLKQAQTAYPNNVEIMLAQGELARFLGETSAAVAAYRRVLAADKRNADAWFGIGRIDAEYEAVRDGKAALERALSIDPAGPGYQGELATLESFADQFSAADRAFHAALEQQPDNYVALTGLGILQLKRGEADAALDSFLKSGVVEPRYARGALYSGVAYYQLGNYPRAMEMFGKAAELDPHDPMPYMMMSLAAADRMELGEAVGAARRAAALMPYLKSANQLLNDQKGNANIGASLALFGMEDWAQAYAHNSYSPYWAGSHLFLSDRYSGEFNKNSELFMGYLSDPTVFGASNRFNTIVASPGHYATLGGRLISEDTRVQGMTITANGYSATPLPFSYFVAADPIRARPGWNDTRARGSNYTLGLGLRPSYELGAFLFGNEYTVSGGNRAGGDFAHDVTLTDRNNRLDMGVNYKFSPTSQWWFKTGNGHEYSDIAGNVFLSNVDALNALVGCDPAAFSLCLLPDASISHYATATTQNDAQLRHTFDASASWQLTWGLEAGHQSKSFDYLESIAGTVVQMPTFPLPPSTQSVTDDDELRSREAYVSNRLSVNDHLALQADLSHIRLVKKQSDEYLLTTFGVPFPAVAQTNNPDISEWNPRLGLSWNPYPGQTLRFALQDWRRPAAVNTLSPVDTAGIPLDDRLVAMGGKLERIRGQYEWETDATVFLQAFVDHERVKNLDNSTNTPVNDFGLEDLQRLSSHNELLPQATDFLEATPSFGQADVDSVGFAANELFADRLSGSLHYFRTHSRNTGAGFAGDQVPWLAKNLLSVGAVWLPAAHWQIGPTLTYRSSRYMDEANTQLLQAGWNLALRSYWESADKHWSFEAVAANLHSVKSSSATHSAIIGVQTLYRL